MLLTALLSVANAATSEPAQSNAALGDAFLAGGPQNSRQEVAQFYPGLLPERKTEWTDFDVKNYVATHWHPGAPLGTTCDELVRLGARGDGGKTVCNPLAVTATAPCLVVSVGSGPSYSTVCEIYFWLCESDSVFV